MSPVISVQFLKRQSDARLVALARAGDERAFETLVKRYRRQLLAYARRLLGAEGRAEDALQQALMQAWVGLRANAEPHEVKPWLFRIVHNASVNILRRQQLPSVELNEAIDTAGATNDLDTRIEYRHALAELAALPDLQRQAIVLTAFGGSSREEVAQTLGLTDGAVRGLVYRARATLRAAAAAVVPAPLIAWAANRGGRRPTASSRLPEMLGGAGSTGAAGLLLKGGAIAITAGALATTGHVVVPALFPARAHVSGAGTAAATTVSPGNGAPAASSSSSAVRALVAQRDGSLALRVDDRSHGSRGGRGEGSRAGRDHGSGERDGGRGGSDGGRDRVGSGGSDGLSTEGGSGSGSRTGGDGRGGGGGAVGSSGDGSSGDGSSGGGSSGDGAVGSSGSSSRGSSSGKDGSGGGSSPGGGGSIAGGTSGGSTDGGTSGGSTGSGTSGGSDNVVTSGDSEGVASSSGSGGGPDGPLGGGSGGSGGSDH